MRNCEAQKKDMNMYQYRRKIISQNIRIRRKARRYTIEELARESGISISTLSAIENERVDNIKLTSLCDIAKALDISIEDIILPMDSNQEIMVDETDEYEIIESMALTDTVKTYYPPISYYAEITSMLELVVILPLLDLRDLLYICSKFQGDMLKHEDYIASQFDWLWKRVPESPARRFAEYEVDRIKQIRSGRDINSIGYDGWNDDNYSAYLKEVEDKVSFVDKLKMVIKKDYLFNR